MLAFFSIFYMLAFGFLSNCYIFICNNLSLTVIFAALFILAECTAGFFLLRAKSIRLRFQFHGTVLLMSFCISVTVSAILNILILANAISCTHSMMIGNLVYCIIANLLLFWNGIICVYLTSVQLGIKIRVLGLVFGMIPILNLVALGRIISVSYAEVDFELAKERLNASRKADEVCKTKYPILFVHGVFFRDFKHFNYWGRIPDELIKNGAVCYYGNHQSALSVKESGEELAERIKEIIDTTGCGKVNIIAHSKGGLDCRYAMKYCGISPYVASLTTINTPHRGCQFADWLLGVAPVKFKASVAVTYNNAARLLGDKAPDFLAAVSNLTVGFCTEFDRETEAPDNVLCQSVGSVMNKAGSGKFPLNLTHNFVKLFDGQNDGLVGIGAFEWGSKYTLITTKAKRGISHGDMIDLNRENIHGFDVREFYVGLVGELKKRGL